MKESGSRSSLVKLAWAITAFDVALSLISAKLPVHGYASVALNILISLWLLVTSLLATSWIVLHQRSCFRGYKGWGTLFVGFSLFSFLAIRDPLAVGDGVSLVLNLVLLDIGWAVMIATVIWVASEDVGLRLVACGCLGVVWSAALGWRFQNEPLTRALAAINSFGSTAPLWWWAPFSCVAWWVIPVGFTGFLAHSIKLLLSEAGLRKCAPHRSSATLPDS